MKTLTAIAFGVFFGLLSAGLVYLTSRPPQGAAITLLPPPTPAPLVVQVSGAVAQPGVYDLPQGSRVRDAIEQAGGLLPSADSAALNLAALLEDGKRLEIPSLPPVKASPTFTPTLRPGSPTAIPTTPPAPTIAAPPPATPVGLVNINTATLEELDTLPGIGPSIAQRIIDYRTANGPFKTIEEIQNVSGIGPATFDKLKDLITVGE